ncbi:ketopantoate reductase family protein [Ancylomarina sp. 16SWW S1-10-2]|uniref:ketopantoate reductase family protein n=1 Tax=Ancylomarina sp. 16SWW S1-10-2 TaxID=2499681 RepID=UPI0012AE590B|nr:2-dehydropantoate 2-reductase [Ancylomarina sp. 16SWW S1-10-2]MRT92639.1 2-dehydropantoate 2-reductase [Ancylomarina sp. 16SWW S1-10-2]
MKIGIIGTGGVGGYFGAKLAAAGNDVQFLARGEHLKAIQSKGLQVKSIKKDVHIQPANASDKISDLSDCDLVIFACKAKQVRETAVQLSKTLKKEAWILPLQNGVLAADELAEFFDRKQILGGLCMIFSFIESPGVISHVGLNEPMIIFGELDQTKSERCKTVLHLFEKADIRCKQSEDIHASLWQKFILICLSGLGAIANEGYGLIRETPESRSLLVDVLTEVSQIAKAKSINLPKDIVEKSMAIVDSYPADSMSSLARDVLSGKSSEIDYQNGTVVRFGLELGIATPANKFVLGMVKLLEQKNCKA